MTSQKIYRILLDDTKKLKRINHLLTQRLKRIHRYGGKNVRNVCVGCHIVPSIATQNAEVLFPIASKHPFSNKVRILVGKLYSHKIQMLYRSYISKFKYLLLFRNSTFREQHDAFQRAETVGGSPKWNI